LILKTVGIEISGGSISYRHKFSTNEFDLFIYLIRIFEDDISKIKHLIFNSYKDNLYSKAESNYRKFKEYYNNNDIEFINKFKNIEAYTIFKNNEKLYEYLNIILIFKDKISNIESLENKIFNKENEISWLRLLPKRQIKLKSIDELNNNKSYAGEARYLKKRNKIIKLISTENNVLLNYNSELIKSKNDILPRAVYL
jgi:hypothetical protein